MSQLQELEKQVSVLQAEIATLKKSQNEAPSFKTAALVIPSPSLPTPAANTSPAPATGSATPPASQSAAPKESIASLLGPTTFSGLVDSYYSYDFNYPADQQTGLRFFEANTNQFALNLAELSVSKTPQASSGITGRTGYSVSFGYGQAIDTVNGPTGAGDGTLAGAQYLKEAYFSYLAPVGNGLTLDVGKFVTTAGDEVIETNGNWNYSRSILFYYAIPFYHFGVRASYAPNSKVSLQASVSNGWNNIVASNSAKTYGGSISITPNSKWGLTETYYAGPVNDLSYWRQLSDTIISFTPNDKWAFAINGDYGRDKNGTVVQWGGAAGYVKYSFSPSDDLAVRYEYYDDPNGFTLFGYPTAGHAQEVTTTYTHMLTGSLMTRFEYRYDSANQPIFTKGSVPNAVKDQNTVLIGMIFTFSSENAK